MLTYALDATTWDLTLNMNGDFATVSAGEQIAQDVASAIRTFLGECWYNTSLGLPYLSGIFGKTPASSFMKAQLTAAASTVPNVQSISVTALRLINRRLTGTVLVSSSLLNSPVTVSF